MTERLYYTDSYLSMFQARIVDASRGDRVYLDRSAFYPSSGGQPHDTGEISGVRVLDVIDEEDAVAHVLERPLGPTGESVTGSIDWDRRFEHMQQHTGQHLLSAVLFEMYGAQTVGFHMGAELCTIELSVPSLSAADLKHAELRANEIVAENRRVSISFEDAGTVEGLRKASERTGTLRVVSIEGLDRSACGGTHVRATGEVGCILLRGQERVRGNLRLEFGCGLRGVRRARADFDALSSIGRSFSAPLDQTPDLVKTTLERVAESEKARRRLSNELAAHRGRQVYLETIPLETGMRFFSREVSSLDDDVRTEAQAFAGAGRGVYIAYCRQPAAILVASSAGSELHAGNVLKSIVTSMGGRGGGSATLAQGSIPDAEGLDAVLQAIRSHFTS